MVERFFYWLLDRLVDFLGGLNPERAKKIEAIKAEAARLDALAKEAALEAQKSEAQYLESVRNREAWDKLIAESREAEKESESRLRDAQGRLAAREDEIKKINQAVLDRSDDAAFGGGVPKSSAGN